MVKRRSTRTSDSTAHLGFEAKLWAAADALRNNMDAAEYKHVVLGLIFLKYISDAFEATHAELEAEKAKGADPEDPDEYRAASIFWVPPGARWSYLKKNAPQPAIGTLVDDAYQNRAIETAQVVEELIALAKDIRDAQKRGEDLGLTDDEQAFYDALGVNDSAVKVLGEPTLTAIARELVAWASAV